MKLYKIVILTISFALNLLGAEQNISIDDLKENVQLGLYCLEKYNFLLSNPAKKFRTIFESINFKNGTLYELPYDQSIFFLHDCDEIEETQNIEVLRKHLSNLNSEWKKNQPIIYKKLHQRFANAKESNPDLKYFFKIVQLRRPLYNFKYS